MSCRLALVATVLIVAVATHVGFVLAVPHALTLIAANRISHNGAQVNRWIYPPRATERSREIVRPSPDLAYAACVFDLRDGPVRITVVPSGAYTSLSLYAPNTDMTLIDATKPVDLVVARPDQTVPPGHYQIIRTKDRWGIALQRRLATKAASFSSIDDLRRHDRCGSVGLRTPTRAMRPLTGELTR